MSLEPVLEPPADGGASSDAARLRLKKAPNAFRTISEVADELHIPQHVLRFWETKFPQVKPLKRGGGRRYYRPDDIALLRRVSDLLYIQGYTIKGVQRLLREGGGKLSDDIPPAPAEERAEAEVEQDAPAPPGDDKPLPVPSLAAGRPPLQPVPLRLVQRTPEGEAERLRTVLRQTLIELESLRALLP
jgi:DNA-binding transcriptional MerR regulator